MLIVLVPYPPSYPSPSLTGFLFLSHSLPLGMPSFSFFFLTGHGRKTLKKRGGGYRSQLERLGGTRHNATEVVLAVRLSAKHIELRKLDPHTKEPRGSEQGPPTKWT